MLRRILLAISVLAGHLGLAQQPSLSPSALSPSALSPSAERVRAQVSAIPVNSKISIVRREGLETYGTLLSSDATTLTYRDVDDNFDKAVPYELIKKVKTGYGGYNFVAHRHTDRTHGLVIGAVVIGALLVLTVIAARS